MMLKKSKYAVASISGTSWPWFTFSVVFLSIHDAKSSEFPNWHTSNMEVNARGVISAWSILCFRTIAQYYSKHGNAKCESVYLLVMKILRCLPRVVPPCGSCSLASFSLHFPLAFNKQRKPKLFRKGKRWTENFWNKTTSTLGLILTLFFLVLCFQLGPSNLYFVSALKLPHRNSLSKFLQPIYGIGKKKRTIFQVTGYFALVSGF